MHGRVQGPPAKYRAELLTGDARAAAWATAVDFYAGYELYSVRCAPGETRSSAFVLSPRERNQCRLSRTLYVEGHDFRDSSPVSGVPIPPTLTL